MRTVAQKMGIKANSKAVFMNAPEGMLPALGLPGLEIRNSLRGSFDHIHFFVTTKKELQKNFEKLKAHLEPDGRLWISWPKNKQLGTDLTLPEVIKTGYSYGLVESICLSVDEVWSALKFTHPQKGKAYHNSHAVLASRSTSR